MMLQLVSSCSTVSYGLFAWDGSWVRSRRKATSICLRLPVAWSSSNRLQPSPLGSLPVQQQHYIFLYLGEGRQRQAHGLKKHAEEFAGLRSSDFSSGENDTVHRYLSCSWVQMEINDFHSLPGRAVSLSSLLIYQIICNICQADPWRRKKMTSGECVRSLTQ